MKILFCTDGSKISFNALNNVSKWVENAIVDTISVIDWSILPDEIYLEQEDFANSCTNMADSIIDYAKDEIKKMKLIPGKGIKTCGAAIESILEQSESEHYDLILMGSHGKKGIQKWLGSVSQEIINSSKISDYIAKEENKGKKILFTTDGTKCSSDILGKILPSMNLCEKEVHICMVNEDPNLLFLEGTLDTDWLLNIERRQETYAAQAIKNIETILSNHNVQTQKTTILTGDVSTQIITYSRENEIDLIVLGSRNKSKLDRFLSGSVSKRVLENVRSDIWLVRCG